MIRADDPVLLTEIAAVTGRAEAEVISCAGGALAPDGDRLPLRRALGVVLLIQFGATGALSPADAVGVAVTVAEGVADGGARALLFGWKGLRPFLRWTDAGGDPVFDDGLHVPVLVIPADQMLSDLAEAVAAVRRDHNRERMH